MPGMRNFPLRAFAVLALAVCLLPVAVASDVSKLKLKARTDKDNPIDYAEGETISFEFRLDGVDELPQAVQEKSPLYVVWKRTGDDGATVWGTNSIALGQRFTATTSLAIPGIVRMQGTLVGSDYQAIEYTESGSAKTIAFGGGAGVATEKMRLSTEEPADFNRFWEDAKSKLASVPMDGAELVEVFPKSNVTNSYRYFAAKIPCFGPRPVTGWLTVPKNAQPGTLAVKATFDGYSVAIAQPSLPTDQPGTGTMLFHVNAHGYDMVGQDAQYYKDFVQTVNSPYYTPSHGKPYSHGLGAPDYDNPTNTYFYFMALRVVRAFDYLKSRPEWNGRDVIAEGLSQGGLQTMWAGSLVGGISKILPEITWGCDIGNSLNATGPFLSNEWGIPNVPGAYYFDAALHAKRVPRTCVAEITRVGLSDYTSPPRGVLLSYYNMKCKVSAKLVQGSDHSRTSVPPDPNQVYVVSRKARPTASDAPGSDFTNRVVTVEFATPGAVLTLTATASDGSVVAAAATVGSDGTAVFDVATAPGKAYAYTVAADGGGTIATGGFLSGGWNAGGPWFSASAASGSSVVSGGEWKNAPPVTDGNYEIDGTAEFDLASGNSASGSGHLVRVESVLRIDAFAGPEDLGAASGGFSTFVAAETDDGSGDSCWMASGADGWTVLHGDLRPREGMAYRVRAEADFAASSPRIRYEVCKEGGDAFEPLYADAACTERWISCASFGAAVSGVDFAGSGAVATLEGALANANVAEADGVACSTFAEALASATNRIALLTNVSWPETAPVGTVSVDLGGHVLRGATPDANGEVVVQHGYTSIPGAGKVNISLERAAALGVATEGKTPSQIAAALAANGANGIPRWMSYVLGLDPANPEAKPGARIAINGGQVELSLVGIEVNGDSGAEVSYRVYKFNDLADMSDEVSVGAACNVGTTAQVAKDSSDSQMFYRLKIDVNGF